MQEWNITECYKYQLLYVQIQLYLTSQLLLLNTTVH